MPKIIETDYGIASRIDDIIYVNKRLSEDLVLYSALINHELGHSSKNTFGDLLHDMKDDNLDGLHGRYYKFILKNPSSWIEFSPITFFNNKIQVNFNLLLFYMIFILMGVILLWLI